ncbi:DMT family transporter [Actinomadura sp. WMMA1423]|uniref:DMT family transporter n=1 Tax=Actinomadura sp. WMMA1423 TaxID=2591108 RepID=UPI001147A3A0|nr:DMT family transporter [Actinomadura sp. WMMA1423]
MIAVVLGLLAAASNALASVLQRRATEAAPEADAFKPSLIIDLLRQPLWLGGVGALIAAFLLQAAALSQAGLALVQPLLAAELPFTMIIIASLPPRGLHRVPWTGVVALTAGLAGFLIAAAPSGGRNMPGTGEWLVATVATVGCAAALVAVAWPMRGPVRGVLLGVTTSLGFALTAAFMRTATREFPAGIGAVLTSWELYAMAAAGVTSLFLLQNALQSGSLVVVQPALTVTDPVASILLGIGLFGEHLRAGMWIIMEAAGILLVLVGSVLIARSPMLYGERTVTSAPRG